MNCVKSIAHRGYSKIAPENTMPAFQLAKMKGFLYVETDIQWTIDDIPVLLHDDTINRTGRLADGSEIPREIRIESITYKEALLYDFGIKNSSQYGGVKIPTFEEFIAECKNLCLHPYIELKGTLNSYRANILVNMIKRADMLLNVTFISFEEKNIEIIVRVLDKARFGLLDEGLNFEARLESAIKLRSRGYEAFLDINYHNLTKDMASKACEKNISIEVWTMNDYEDVDKVSKLGVSGITTDSLILNVL